MKYRNQISGGGLPRLRYQLGGAILAVMLPAILMFALSPLSPFDVNLVIKTGLYSISAAILGILMLRSVSQYPGVEANAYMLPSFAISYGVLLTVLILARLPYSRLLLFSSFVMVLIWLVVIQNVANRQRTLTIGVVPGGDHESLLPIPGVRWIVFSDPAQDSSSMQAVTADLRVDLPPEWDRRLADFALEGVPVYHTKHLAESLTGMVQLEHLSENSFGTLSPITVFMQAKHTLDWIIAAIAIVVLAPFLLLIALAIRLDSAGPVIFRQTRAGFRGQWFTVYKFRTMTVAGFSGTTLDEAKTQSEDKRITRVGAFLRRSRIDELPQILNILQGEMSWIGPRPEARVLSEWYERQIPFYRYRHIVRPGLTGWAQVNQGHVAEVEDVRNKLYFDFYYIKNYSPWIDLLIVAKTIQTVMTGFGAK